MKLFSDIKITTVVLIVLCCQLQLTGQILSEETETIKPERTTITKDSFQAINEIDSLKTTFRKKNQFGFIIGVNSGFQRMYTSLFTDTVQNGYLGHDDCFLYGLKLSGGWYFGENHFLGLSTNLNLIRDSGYLIESGFRYMFIEPGYRNKVKFYVPIEMNYALLVSQVQRRSFYYTDDNDLVLTSEFIDASFQNIGIQFGVGLSFLVANKQTLNLELSLVQQFGLQQTTSSKQVDTLIPDQFNLHGFRLSVAYCF